MLNDEKQPTLTQKVHEYIKTRGCVTTREVAKALNISTTKAYIAIRALYTKRFVLPYRPQLGREHVFCVPDVGDKLYGRENRINITGLICITLPIDMIEVLDEIAIRTGKTRSSVIRETLMQMMGAYLGEDDQSEQPHESSGDEELEFITPIR
jgi:hypothetical protein